MRINIQWRLEASCWLSHWSSGYAAKLLEGSVGGAVRRWAGILQKENRPLSKGNDPSEGSRARQSVPGFWQEDGEKMSSIAVDKNASWRWRIRNVKLCTGLVTSSEFKTRIHKDMYLYWDNHYVFYLHSSCVYGWLASYYNIQWNNVTD